MALSDIDRNLLARCLSRKPRAWEDFVDRFMGLVVHVANHTSQSRSIRLTPNDLDDLVSEVFFSFVKNDFESLRHFRGESSLATYLTVIARRVVVHQLLKRRGGPALSEIAPSDQLSPEQVADPATLENAPEQRMSDREEVERLMGTLDDSESRVVRLYHLEGKSYQEISIAIGMPMNSIGPALSRARAKMRDRAGSQ